MDYPRITINGIEYVAHKPKAKAWEVAMTLSEKLKTRPYKEYAAIRAEIIAEVFDLTTTEIIDGIDIDELVPKCDEVIAWIIKLISGKADELEKNAKSPAEK